MDAARPATHLEWRINFDDRATTPGQISDAPPHRGGCGTRRENLRIRPPEVPLRSTRRTRSLARPSARQHWCHGQIVLRKSTSAVIGHSHFPTAAEIEHSDALSRSRRAAVPNAAACRPRRSKPDCLDDIAGARRSAADAVTLHISTGERERDAHTLPIAARPGRDAPVGPGTNNCRSAVGIAQAARLSLIADDSRSSRGHARTRRAGL